MKINSLIFLSVFSLILFGCVSKPKALLLGKKKGNMDKLTFMSAKELELSNNRDSLWKIISYEYNYSCNGEIMIKSFSGQNIPKEVIDLVKGCKYPTVSDFRSIKARNRITGKIKELNAIMITAY